MSRYQNSGSKSAAGPRRTGRDGRGGARARSAAWTAAPTSRGLSVDDDVPAEQDGTDDLPGVRRRVTRADGDGGGTGGVGLGHTRTGGNGPGPAAGHAGFATLFTTIA